MVLGQSAATAACMAVDLGVPVQIDTLAVLAKPDLHPVGELLPGPFDVRFLGRARVNQDPIP